MATVATTNSVTGHHKQPASGARRQASMSWACTASQQATGRGQELGPAVKRGALDSDTAPPVWPPCRHLLPRAFLEYATCSPSSGPLHVLFPPPRMFSSTLTCTCSERLSSWLPLGPD